jgi:hypothetical protein
MNALDLIGGALRLDPVAFAALLASDPRLGTAIVYFAGLSTAIGQSIALFTARVSPRRFAFALGVQAALFLGGFLLWAASTHLLARALYGAEIPLVHAIGTIGLAHAPLLFGALVLAPYLGTPLQTLLSIWTLLAVVIATTTTWGLTTPAAIACGSGGWIVSHLLQRTIGRSIVRVAARVRRRLTRADRTT